MVCSNACRPFHAGSVQSINILPSILLQPELATELELSAGALDVLEALLVDAGKELMLEGALLDDALELVIVRLDELRAAEVVALDELLAIEELVVFGSSLGKLVGVEGVVVPPVPAPPPPQALNITAAAKSSERDFIFIIKIH